MFLSPAGAALAAEKTKITDSDGLRQVPDRPDADKTLDKPADHKILDRTVAVVDDDAILLSDLQARFALAKKLAPDITQSQVLQTMINRTLLLREARKIFPETMSDEQAIKEFTDFKIRAFVVVPEESIRNFYEENKAKMGGAPYERVRGQIEGLLTEKEINRRLEDYLKGLRQKAYIRVFLTNTPEILKFP